MYLCKNIIVYYYNLYYKIYAINIINPYIYIYYDKMY